MAYFSATLSGFALVHIIDSVISHRSHTAEFFGMLTSLLLVHKIRQVSVFFCQQIDRLVRVFLQFFGKSNDEGLFCLHQCFYRIADSVGLR
jgi:hypothetical protein